MKKRASGSKMKEKDSRVDKVQGLKNEKPRKQASGSKKKENISRLKAHGSIRLGAYKEK